MSPGFQVFADLRFHKDTGIGKVQTALMDRGPSGVSVVDLHVQGRYGHPLSPVRIAQSLKRAQPHGRSVFWSCGFIPPARSAIPVVVTVHDLTHLTYYGSAKRTYFNRVLRPLYRRCDLIACVSDFTRTEFLEWSGMEPSRVVVIPNGVDASYLDNQIEASLGFPYVFYAGNHRPYKNLHRLIRAYSISRLSTNNVHLVMTGHADPDLVAVVRECGVEGQVHFAGHLDEQDLPSYYRGALAVPYVSMAEGFGLPILEAMASGTPVITSNLCSMPEVAGDAALIVDPTSVLEIATALDSLLDDEELRERLVRRGFDRVAAFQWDESGRLLWDALEALAQSNPGASV